MYFFKSIAPDGKPARLAPRDMGLEFLSLERLEISGWVCVESGGEELCCVIVRGAIEYAAGETAGTVASGNAAERDMLYVPPGYAMCLRGDATVIRYGAPCARQTSFAHIAFADVDSDARHKVYGKSEEGTRRDVWNYIDDGFDSSRLLVGITYGSKGGWTAWPPHEHGDRREEVYYYFGMGDGFGIQCVYGENQTERDAVIVRDGDIVAIPEGYHPNTGCPKTGLRYIYCMASKTPEDRRFMDLHIQEAFGDKLE